MIRPRHKRLTLLGILEQDARVAFSQEQLTALEELRRAGRVTQPVAQRLAEVFGHGSEYWLSLQSALDQFRKHEGEAP